MNSQTPKPAESQQQPEPIVTPTPKFGLLLLVCFLTIVFCGVLVWFATTYLPDCCEFPWLYKLFR